MILLQNPLGWPHPQTVDREQERLGQVESRIGVSWGLRIYDESVCNRWGDTDLTLGSGYPIRDIEHSEVPTHFVWLSTVLEQERCG